MNLVVLLIAAWLPLVPMLFILLRSGSFGKGSVGTLLKLFFLGVAAAVPAFLMEAGALLALTLLLGIFPETAFGGNMSLIAVILRCFLASALIEECWKHFVLRVSTWEKMTMETVADGIAAAGVVSTGFSAMMYGFWQAGYRLVPSDIGFLRGALPVFLSTGPVVSFLFALLFIFSHFGFSGFMGALYGIAKGSEQKAHGRRAGIMLFMSCLLPILVHGLCLSLICWGIVSEKILWTVLGFAAQTLMGVLMAASLNSAADAQSLENLAGEEEPVDFADSEEFADFAEASGGMAADWETADGEAADGGSAVGEAADGEAPEGGSAAGEEADPPGTGSLPFAEDDPEAGEDSSSAAGEDEEEILSDREDLSAL